MTQQSEATLLERKTAATGAWKWVALGVVALLSGLLLAWLLIEWLTPYQYHGTVIQSPSPTTDFTLTGAGGEPVRLSDFRGQTVLLYFGYTYCPDACPATMVELAQAMEYLGDEAEQVQVVLISVDPARDTPERLQEYVSHFDSRFMGLTGSDEQLLAATTPLGIYYQKHAGSVTSGYLIDHTASVVVIDADGYLRLVYPFGTPAEDIAADLQALAG